MIDRHVVVGHPNYVIEFKGGEEMALLLEVCQRVCLHDIKMAGDVGGSRGSSGVGREIART